MGPLEGKGHRLCRLTEHFPSHLSFCLFASVYAHSHAQANGVPHQNEEEGQPFRWWWRR